MALACCSGISPAPNLVPQTPGLASVKGRIFLITVGGDLKPGRLATVYLLSLNPFDQETFAKKEEAVQKWCVDMESWIRRFGSPDFPRSWVTNYESALSDLEETVRSRAMPPEKFAFMADEEGLFSSTPVSAGGYVIVAFGQAGVNRGYWVSQLQLHPGEHKEIKMSSPSVACDLVR